MKSVMTPTLTKTTLGCVLFASLFCVNSAYAVGMNCNVSQLSLTASQKTQLKQLRNEYRIGRDELMRKKSSAAVSRRDFAKILMQDDFNEQAARQYVTDKYLYSASLDMQDLRMQHAFFKVLTPQQKQLWLQHCQN